MRTLTLTDFETVSKDLRRANRWDPKIISLQAIHVNIHFMLKWFVLHDNEGALFQWG